GSNHPDLVSILQNYALVYLELGKYGKAESMTRRSLKIAEEAYGPNHPNVAMAVSNLMAIYQKQGKDKEARSLAKKYEKIGMRQP
ncbi:MAG: tetratricopeptide repeat protein, partial [Myxococcota bacterium]